MNHPVILTFDVEDWYQLCGRHDGTKPPPELRARLRPQVGRILDLLDEYRAQATFFVLGITAESFPDVVDAIVRRGHEIGSHSYGHRVLHCMDRHEFVRDVQASVEVLKGICGKAPLGYRAPEFSIDHRAPWALDVLLDAGFSYDSSVFPFRGPRYGIPDAEIAPGNIATTSGRSLMEIPLSVYLVRSRRLPVAGGGYWRAMPCRLIRRVVSDIAAKRPPVLYFHPAEFDDEWLWNPTASWGLAYGMLRQNVGRRTIAGKLRAVLSAHRAVSIAGYLSGSTRPSLSSEARLECARDVDGAAMASHR
jgi:polysaccharide deacetylase family protein (PEP-CTERM system associated)